MRNIFNFIIFLLVCFFAYHFFNHSSENRVLRIGTECDYPPNNWEEDIKTKSNVPLSNFEGRYAEGYDIQIAKLVAKSMRAKLEVKKISWQDLIPALKNGEIDAIFSGMLDTSERKKDIAFSEVYDIQDSKTYGIMVRKDSNYANAKTLNDFIGASFVAQKDSNLDRAISQVKGAIHLPPVLKVQEFFDMLQNGKADAKILDLESASTYLRMFPDFVIIKFPEEESFKFDYNGVCAGVRKDDTKLLREINDALRDIPRRDRQKIMDQIISETGGSF